MMMQQQQQPSTWMLMAASAFGGAALTWSIQQVFSSFFSSTRKKDPETDYTIGHGLVWNSITGSMNAAMMYVGDKLKLYETIHTMCSSPSSSSPSSSSSDQTTSKVRSVTAVQLAQETGYNQRWLREWLAQQAAMGVLTLLPGDGNDDSDLKYRLPTATGEVLANPESSEYDISMIQVVPALVNRAKTMLPEAFSTGIGRPYDEPDVAEAIDRHHTNVVRDFVIPQVLPMAKDGLILKQLQDGCMVADLGCGAGVLLVMLAKQYPKSTFHGFEISTVALEKAAYNVASSKLTNVFLHDANQPGQQLGDMPGQFDLALIYDVLHDSTHPSDLVKQVYTSLKPNGLGHFLCGDIPSMPTVRENLTQTKAPATYYGFSTCLCMSCALSTKDGAGLGTLGFSIPVAKQMLTANGFTTVDVLAEDKNVRWFLAY